MDPEKMEVFCTNIECGDTEVRPDLLSPTEARRYRRMTYMGKREIGPGRVVKGLLLNKPAPPPGRYHFFSCPVCGSKRAFHEYKGLVREVDNETAKLVA